MYIKNGIYPYSVAQLRQDNPGISFPENISESLLAEFEVYPVELTSSPTVDHTSTVREGLPVFEGGKWKQVWVVEALPASQVNDTVANLRKQAYIEEADPLFFKYQRGDATKEEWLAVVNAIKIRYPYVD
jgi:hypothetical protein